VEISLNNQNQAQPSVSSVSRPFSHVTRQAAWPLQHSFCGGLYGLASCWREYCSRCLWR